VYTQNVDEKLSGGDVENSCRRVHGHSGKLEVTLGSESLDERGFVMDYKEMGFIKKFIAQYLDHRTILGIDDPLWDLFSDKFNLFADKTTQPTIFPHFVKVITDSDEEVVKQLADSLTLVAAVPTSEVLANLIQSDIGLYLFRSLPFIKVMSVGWSETEKSIARYMPSC